MAIASQGPTDDFNTSYEWVPHTERQVLRILVARCRTLQNGHDLHDWVIATMMPSAPQLDMQKLNLTRILLSLLLDH